MSLRILKDGHDGQFVHSSADKISIIRSHWIGFIRQLFPPDFPYFHSLICVCCVYLLRKLFLLSRLVKALWFGFLFVFIMLLSYYVHRWNLLKPRGNISSFSEHILIQTNIIYFHKVWYDIWNCLIFNLYIQNFFKKT